MQNYLYAHLHELGYQHCPWIHLKLGALVREHWLLFCFTMLPETVGKLWTNMFATLALQIKVAFEGGA